MSAIDPRDAYECLHALTEPGTVGRQAIESLRFVAYPEELAAQRATEKNYCPYCLGWMGGPLLCCENYRNPSGLEFLTEAQAMAQRERIANADQ